MRRDAQGREATERGAMSRRAACGKPAVVMHPEPIAVPALRPLQRCSAIQQPATPPASDVASLLQELPDVRDPPICIYRGDDRLRGFGSTD